MEIGVNTVPDSSKELHIDAKFIAWTLDKSPTTKVEIIQLKTIETAKIELTHIYYITARKLDL